MQTIATLLLRGTTNMVACERSVIAEVPSSGHTDGDQRVDGGATNGSDGVELIRDIQLPGNVMFIAVTQQEILSIT